MGDGNKNKVPAATKKAIREMEERLTKLIDSKLNSAMSQMKGTIEDSVSCISPSSEDKLRDMIKDCIANSSLLTNTPASAIHG